MDETKYRALVVRWNAPPPGVAASPAADAQEGAAFMAFMGAHQALRSQTGGDGG